MILDRLRYWCFRANSAVFHRVRKRFTRAGWLVLSGLAASAVWGVDTDQTMAFQSFTFLAALIALSFLSVRGASGGLRLRRTLPRFGTAGEPLPYVIRVDNGRAGSRGLLVGESMDDPRPTFEQFRSCRAGRDGSGLFERLIGLDRWRSLVLAGARASSEEMLVPDLPPEGSCELRTELAPLRRGVLRLEALWEATLDPFGILKAQHAHLDPQSVLILPRRYPVSRLLLPGLRKYQRGGVALSLAIGDSLEFASLRDYRPGDPLRGIHWRSWAKTGKPIVRENLDEYFVRHALVLDTFGVPGPAFEEAVSVAASFSCTVLTQESLLDLLFIGAEAYCFSAGRGLGGAERMLEVLACVQPCSGKSFDELHGAVARRHAALSGSICVLLAWDERRKRFIDGLKALGVPVLTVVVAAPVPAPPDVHFLEPGKVAEGLARLS